MKAIQYMIDKILTSIIFLPLLYIPLNSYAVSYPYFSIHNLSASQLSFIYDNEERTIKPNEKMYEYDIVYDEPHFVRFYLNKNTYCHFDFSFWFGAHVTLSMSNNKARCEKTIQWSSYQKKTIDFKLLEVL